MVLSHAVSKALMIDNQLGRRNLTEGQMSYLRGERYKLEKQSHGGDRKSEEKSSSQNDHLIKTAQKFSAQYKVSPKPTVSLGGTSAVVCTYGCGDGRIAPTRCAVIGSHAKRQIAE